MREVALTEPPSDGPGGVMGDAGEQTPGGADEEQRVLCGAPPVLAALRRAGDEAQLTRVIGALGASDSAFADGYAKALLRAAAARPQFEESVAQFASPPAELRCCAEFALGARTDRHGRVDLRLHAPGFSLLVEHKLWSAFAHDQLERYGRYVRSRPSEERHALIAVTRNVPTEQALNAPTGPGWLGVVRWVDLIDDLFELPHQDLDARGQWRTLLKFMLDQGDLGVAKADKQLVDAWGHQSIARDHLADILGQARERADETVHKALDRRFARHGGRDQAIAMVTYGKTGVTVKRQAADVWIAWALPAGSDEALGIGFLPDHATRATMLYSNVRPIDFATRYDVDPMLRRAVRQLEAHGFEAEKSLLRRKHRPEDWVEAPDVAARIVDLFAGDVATIAESGILRGQFTAAAPQRRGVLGARRSPRTSPRK